MRFLFSLLLGVLVAGTAFWYAERMANFPYGLLCRPGLETQQKLNFCTKN